MTVITVNGKTPVIAEDAFVAATAVVAGDVTIEAGASIWFGAVLRGDSAPIRVGARTNIQDNCTIHVDEGVPCSIGADCSIGHNAVIHGATIEDGVLIGIHATVLNGATIGREAIVAAAALIPEGYSLAPGHVAMGVPAKAVRTVSEPEHMRVQDGVRHYGEFARQYASALSRQDRDIS